MDSPKGDARVKQEDSRRVGVTRSSRAQARATLGWEFPIFALSMAKRGPSPTLVHGSCALSKIPYGGFSPVRLQAEASRDQLSPARWSAGLKHQVCIPPFDHRFDRAFVVLMPSCFRGVLSTPQPQAVWTTPSAHGSLAPSGLCCPTHLHSYDPIRQSRRLPLISQGHWLYGGSLPDDLVWAVPETFPALGQRSVPTCHPPYAGRRPGCLYPGLPQPHGPSPIFKWVGACAIPTPSSVGGSHDAARFA